MMTQMIAHTNLCRDRPVSQTQLVAAKHRKRVWDMVIGTIEAIRKTALHNIRHGSSMDEAEDVVIEEEGGEIADGAMTEAVDEVASRNVATMAFHNHLMNSVTMVIVNHRKAHRCLLIHPRTITTTTTMPHK